MRARRSRSTVVTAATLGALLATGALIASPAAYAADAPAATSAATTNAATAAATAPATASAEPTARATAEAGRPSLAVNPPASIGNGGRPVEFTETVTNPGSAEASFTLKLDASNPAARSAGRLTIDYRGADGGWKPVELAFGQDDTGFRFSGEIPGVTVAAGSTRTLQLRMAAPLNNDWTSVTGNVRLHSAIVDAGKAVVSESTKDVALKAVTVQVGNAPATAVVGGAPVEFDVTFTNPSASGYDNVSRVVQTDKHTTLQVRKADGGWQDVTATPSSQPGSAQVTYHLTDDRTLAPGAAETRHVRLAFAADAPLGTVYVDGKAVLGEGGPSMPAHVGPQAFPVRLTATPAATAATLTVQAPASIGNGGKPVEFTETVTNPGGADASYTLKLKASNQWARSKDRITLEYRDADGTWKPVALNFSAVDRTFDFAGEIPGVTVAAGATRTLQLRMAAPLNNDWAAQSGTVELHSAIVDAGNTVVSENTEDVALKALEVKAANTPNTAVVGGAPVEFDVIVTNASASGYDNASLVVLADAHSSLQVRKADGGWENVTGTAGPQAGSPVAYHLTGDRNLTAGATVTKHVRLAFTTGAPLGKKVNYVNPEVILGEGGPSMPAYVGPQGFLVDLTDAPAGGADDSTGTAVKAGLLTTDDGSGSTGGRLTGGELAHTGSDGVLRSVAGAAALLVSGIGAVFFARRRRSA
ncbi:hypothetical protein ACGF07_27265 [Kitasatospora sp. NPDC048194]|uniref:hypothetical protein n=1 Tax=Kitasatospora sp. NPDC048194 TaxID=3364045 RepID=UPI0037199A60